MYNKLMLKNGDVLNDTHINHLENGILKVESESNNFRKIVSKIVTSKGIPAYETDSFDVLSNKINLLGQGIMPPNPPPEEGQENELIDIRQTVQSGEIQMVVSDIAGTFCKFQVYTSDNSQFSVDWGDGTSDIVNSGSYAEHTYQVGVGGQPYLENNTQWVVTVSSIGNVIKICRPRYKPNIIWFASKDIIFSNIDAMFSGGDTNAHAPENMKYVDIIGGALFPNASEPHGSFSAGYAFRGCFNLERITGVINTSLATSMTQFYYECRSLVEVPAILDCSKTTSLSYAFRYCNSLPAIPNLVNTSNVQSFYYTFHECTSITEIPDLDLSSCTNATAMLHKCTKLIRADNITNTGKLQYAGSMFSYCSALNKVPNILDLGNATDASDVFSQCFSLIDSPAIIHLDSAISIKSFFSGCTLLRTAPTVINAPNVIEAYGLFYGCSSLRNAPQSVSLPVANKVQDMFCGCRSMTTAPEVMDFPNAVDAWKLFYTCEMLKKPPRVVNLPNALNVSNMFNGCVTITETPEIINIGSAQRSDSLFHGCNLLSTLHFNEINLPNSVEIYNMFYSCKSLVNGPRIIAPQAQQAYGLFQHCSKLESVQPIDLPEALNVANMYRDCPLLQHIPALNAPKATHWNEVYRDCRTLQSVENVGGPAAQYINYMFYSGCPLINKIPTNLDFGNVINSDYWMYKGDPVRITGDFIIKPPKTFFEFYNVRNVTSIRLIEMDPLCGNLNFRNCGMNEEALNLLFGDLIETITPATITVTGNPGADTCDPTIAEAKGWTVTI